MELDVDYSSSKELILWLMKPGCAESRRPTQQYIAKELERGTGDSWLQDKCYFLHIILLPNKHVCVE